MKLIKTLSALAVMFVLMGAASINDAPVVQLSTNNTLKVTGLGNNLAGLEVSIKLLSGSFDKDAFTPAVIDSQYIFDKIDDKTITIYVTSPNDLTENGELHLGSLKATSGASYNSKVALTTVDFTLLETEYSTSLIKDTNSTTTTPGTSGGTSNNNGSNSLDTTVESYEFVVQEGTTTVTVEEMASLVTINKDKSVIIKVGDISLTFPKGTMEVKETTTVYDFNYLIDSKYNYEINTLTNNNTVVSFSFSNDTVLPLIENAMFQVTLNTNGEYTNTALYLYKYYYNSNTSSLSSMAYVNENGEVVITVDGLYDYFLTESALSFEDEIIPDEFDFEIEDEYDGTWFIINVSILSAMSITCAGYYAYKLYLKDIIKKYIVKKR